MAIRISSNTGCRIVESNTGPQARGGVFNGAAQNAVISFVHESYDRAG